MKSKGMDFEFFLIIVAGLFSIAVALNAKIKGDFKERQLQKSQDSLNISQSKLADVQNELIVKAEEIIEAQRESKIKTEEVIKVQERLQVKSDEVARLSQELISKQEKSINDYERELNPLLPLSFEIRFEIPFSSKIIPKMKKDGIEKMLLAAENGEFLGSDRIEVYRVSDNVEIQGLKVKNPIGELYKGLSLGFLLSSTVDVFFYKKQSDVDSGEFKDLILSGHLALGSDLVKYSNSTIYLSKKNNFIDADFKFGILVVRNPVSYKPIGLKDIENAYVVIKPPFGGEFKIVSLLMQGGSGKTLFNISLFLRNHEIYKDGNRFFYVHKIKPSEISTKVK